MCAEGEMKQDFSNVSEERLAELFPVILEPHNPEWAKLYIQEEERICRLFGEGNIVRISHIGSTAVKGILAKPTIDILAEVVQDFDIQGITGRMQNEGYVVNRPAGDLVMFLKGYTSQGFLGQAFHIHVRYSGDWGELYFRDYLNGYPSTGVEYEQLKVRLKGEYLHDRDGYTEAKGELVRRYTNLARLEYGERYKP